MSCRTCLCAAFVLFLAVVNVNGFVPRVLPSGVTQSSARRCRVLLHMSDSDEEGRLRALGYSEDEIRRSKKEPDREEIKVRVDVVDDIDAFSLTAIGFGLIALNFLVFANMGDGGIAGVVATVMNTWGN